MRFHIVVIKIRSELAEIEFAKKKFQIFYLCVLSLLSTLRVLYNAFYDSQNQSKNPIFQKSILSVEKVRRSIQC